MTITSFLHHIILSPVACPALPYFSTLSHTWHNFYKKILEHKVCVLIFYTSYAGKISHFKMNSVKYYINLYRSSCKVHVILAIYY